MNEILTLNNGVQMPALGLGVFQSSKDDTAAAVEAALRTGYRHIDTAAAYMNEREVGDGLRASGVDRDEVFIETKVWISQYGYEETLHAFDVASRKLGVERIDLLILHQPAPWVFDATIDAYRLGDSPRGREGRVHRRQQLQARSPRPPSRGDHRDPGGEPGRTAPYFTQIETQQADAARGIVTQAWSPIGGINFYPGWGDGTAKNPLQDPVIAAIGATHGKKPVQVMIRWHLQQGRSAIPKSVRPQRIAENFDVFDFELADAELASIDGLDLGIRRGPEPDEVRPRARSFIIPED